MKVLFTTLMLYLCINPIFAQSVSFNKNVVSNRLQSQMAESPNQLIHFSILLADRVDMAQFDKQLYKENATLQQRSRRVNAVLKAKAKQSQPPLIDWLKQQGEVDKKSIHSYWITNVIFVKAAPAVIARLSWMPAVARLDWNAPLELVEHTTDRCATAPPAPGGKESGIETINAPAMWRLGYTGNGRTGLVSDTGIDGIHPALRSQYKGLYQPAEHSWYTQNNLISFPFDCDGHGTHVNGTMMGINRLTRDTIGVAYNANWIGAGILCGIGTEDNIGAFQWSIDPDKDSTTIADMPDVINNSWRDPSLDDECSNIYLDVLNAVEASGIAVVFSAGNSGPLDTTITKPHNINQNLVNIFTVGALNGHSSNLPIASFSSRGPSICPATDSSLVIKPEVSAPGVNVRSSFPDNTYGTISGTSMAAPHVSGAVLLLKEAFPFLTGQEIKLALYFSARDLGRPGEDNIYGMGIIDVKAAYDYLVAQGHTPIQPAGANDVTILEVRIRDFYCNEVIYPEIIFENNGIADLTSVDVQVELPEVGITRTAQWTGTLKPGEREFLLLDELNVPLGDWFMIITLSTPNGVDDDRPFNNKIMKRVTVTDRPSINAYLESIVPGSVCKNGRALLRSNFDAQGDVSILWYDAPTGGNFLGEGFAFLTEPLDTSQTFYADASIVHKIGPEDSTIGDFLFPPAVLGGLRFDVKTPLTIKSVKIYAQKTGERSIVLKDSNNEILVTRNVDIQQVGSNRIDLDIPVNTDTDYQLEMRQGIPFGMNRTGAQYPYDVQDVITVQGNTLGSSLANAWFYFYDWEVEYNEVCGRSPVHVAVVPGQDIPHAAFDVSEHSVDVRNDPTIIFTDLSAGATAWQWNFGDGNSSTTQNPVHTYQAPGTYVVSLTVLNAEGCSAAAIDTIEVLGISVGTNELTLPNAQIKVFPNPVRSQLNIQTNFKNEKALAIYITDALGKPVRTIEKITSKSTFDIDISSFHKGVYFLIFSVGNKRLAQKIVKL